MTNCPPLTSASAAFSTCHQGGTQPRGRTRPLDGDVAITDATGNAHSLPRRFRLSASIHPRETPTHADWGTAHTCGRKRESTCVFVTGGVKQTGSPHPWIPLHQLKTIVPYIVTWINQNNPVQHGALGGSWNTKRTFVEKLVKSK